MSEITTNKFSIAGNLMTNNLIYCLTLILAELLVLLSLGYKYYNAMNNYEVIIYFSFVMTLTYMSWYWNSLIYLVIVIALGSTISISLYGNDLEMQNSNFWLIYILSSQSAIMWMSALFVIATLFYGYSLLLANNFSGFVANQLTWAAIAFGFIALCVRWNETYLISPEIGYIPVSNLYEVFIVFCLFTSLLYLYYENRVNTYKLGFFCLLIISAAVAFLLWYTFDREAYHIQPLTPALNSYWMKIHVPANFIGYGSFSLACMTSIAWLFTRRYQKHAYWKNKLPNLEIIDNITYKAIALGFVGFTIATILGALWAAEAWGGYWSWDPKETWALIVWLNYASWLHFRLSKGWRGDIMAWWAIFGLFITLFAFLGVNMFLSGLHSYGTL